MLYIFTYLFSYITFAFQVFWLGGSDTRVVYPCVQRGCHKYLYICAFVSEIWFETLELATHSEVQYKSNLVSLFSLFESYIKNSITIFVSIVYVQQSCHIHCAATLLVSTHAHNNII